MTLALARTTSFLGLLVLLGSALSAQTGMQLYDQHCGACHGERGRGDGPAARFLEPKPRDFRSGYFRFVSTDNGVPSDTDILEAISAGLPGSAMLGFTQLTPQERILLVNHLRGMRRAGIRERLAGAGLGEAALEEEVLRLDTPGAVVRPAPETPDTMESRARGAMHWTRLCASCHGDDGRGVTDPLRITAEGAMARPRDLTRGILKSGHEIERLWQRVRCGIPGTPMPKVSAADLPDDALWDLLHFLTTLIPSGSQALRDPLRWRLDVPRLGGALPTDPDDERLRALPPTWIALAPMQAHLTTVSGVMLQAAHDGEHVVLRLQYADRTLNGASGTAGAPDGVAVRLTSTARPPVLPLPGLPLPLDRALWLSSAKPAADDPIFEHIIPRFENPDSVCKSPIGPEHVGKAHWRDGLWTVLMLVRPERAGRIAQGEDMPLSLAVFDGANARGPLPSAFSHWQTLHFLP